MDCIHKGELLAGHNRSGLEIIVSKCEVFGKCCPTAEAAKLLHNTQSCEGCEKFFNRLTRKPFNFAYVMASTRPQDVAMMQAAIGSARAVGVTEDFHVYATAEAAGAINHPIPFGLDWDNHMAKIRFIAETLRGNDYDAAVWLDSDSWFVRDPGDLRLKLRDNPIWVSMEGAITDPRASQRHNDWWTMWAVGKGRPDFVEIMRTQGCIGQTIYSTNGGCWIVRKSAVEEFVERITSVSNSMRLNNPRISDEPPLAVLGQTIVKDFELNTVENMGDFWACDWVGRWRDRLPDGSPWLYQDWMTGREWEINPAIVHVMRSKHLMTAWPGHNAPAVNMQPKERVGSKLKEVLAECGIVPDENCSCNRMRDQMDLWGVEGCMEHQREIVSHLDAASRSATWMQWAKVAARGYTSSRSLLIEVIRRAEADSQLSAA